MSDVVHNLPPANGADKDPEKWENAYDKDPRGIDKAWDTAKRIKSRKVEEAENFDTAESAKEAVKGPKRAKARKVEPADETDPRNFEYYQKKDK